MEFHIVQVSGPNVIDFLETYEVVPPRPKCRPKRLTDSFIPIPGSLANIYASMDLRNRLFSASQRDQENASDLQQKWSCVFDGVEDVRRVGVDPKK